MWEGRGEETADTTYEVIVLGRDSGARRGRGCLVSIFQKYRDEVALPLPTKITSNLYKTMHTALWCLST